jgi:hypothetical protein
MRVKQAQVLTEINAGERMRISGRVHVDRSGAWSTALPRSCPNRRSTCAHRLLRPSRASCLFTNSPSWAGKVQSRYTPHSRVGVAGSGISGFSRMVVTLEHVDTDRIDSDDRAELLWSRTAGLASRDPKDRAVDIHRSRNPLSAARSPARSRESWWCSPPISL